ncbi:hypothetical protein, partial [Enterococcus faecium]
KKCYIVKRKRFLVLKNYGGGIILKSKFIYGLLSVGLVSVSLIGMGSTVNADKVNENSDFKNKANEIFYSENSKIESVIDEHGEQKTLISLEKTTPSLKNNALKNTKEVTKEKSAAVYSMSVNEVMKKRNDYFLRGTGSLEDSSGTAKGVVDARVTYEYNTIGSSGVTYYGINFAEGRYYPSQFASTSGRRIHYGQQGQNPLSGSVNLARDQYPGATNYQWISYQPSWISDAERVSAIYGALGVTTYATYTMDGSSDNVSVTVSPF